MNMFIRLFLSLVLALPIIGIQKSYSQKIIKLEKMNGIYKIPCTVNGIPMSFIFDTGASDVSISLTEAMFLAKQGLLTNKDIKEDIKYKLANGKIEEGTKIILRQVIIEGLLLENIEASIVHNLDAPLLLGLNAISKLGKVVFEGDKLLIYPQNIPQQEKSKNLIDSTFYIDVQQAFVLLFQSLKNKDPKIFIEKCRHLFVVPDTFYNEEEYLIRKFKNDTINNNRNTQALDNMIKENYERLFSFGIKHTLNWSNILPEEIKFSIDNSDVIITFRHNNDFYVMKSWFYLSSSNKKNVIDFPTVFESIKAYVYNKHKDAIAEEYNNKKITYKERLDKNVEYSERQYQYLSKTDMQYIRFTNRLEDAYHLRGIYRYQNNDNVGAIQDWNKIISLPTAYLMADAYYCRGRSKKELGDYKGAILDFNKYISLDQNREYKFVYLLRGDSRFSLKNYTGALEDYNKAIIMNPKDYHAYYNRGFVNYFHLNNKKGGCSDWSKAGELGLKEAYELINKNCQ